MNKYKFIEYLHHPKTVTADQQEKLTEVVEDYPYFQTARTLIAKVKKNHEESNAKQYINSAALYVFDRNFFKKYLENDLFFLEPKEASKQRSENADKPIEKPIKQAPIQKTKVLSAEIAKDKTPVNKEVAAPQPPKPSAKPVQQVTEKPAVAKTDAATTPGTTDLDKLIAEVYQDMADLRKSKARFLEWQEKNDMEEAIEKAMSASSNKVAPAKENKKNSTASKSSDKKESQKDQSQISTKASDPSTQPTTEITTEVKKEEVKKPKKPVSPKKAITKKETLKSSSTKKSSTKTAAKKSSDTPKKITGNTDSKNAVTDKSQTIKEEPKAVKQTKKAAEEKGIQSKAEENQNKSANQTEAPKKADESVTKTSSVTSEKDEIIDKFIEAQPSITKPEADSSVPKGDLSKPSTRFHADIASEYLAEIYIEQGKNNRAIEIYENLGLKFPEKKSYFAGLIEKLKKE